MQALEVGGGRAAMKQRLWLGLGAVFGLRVLVVVAGLGYVAWTGNEDLYAGRPEVYPILLAVAAGQILITLAMVRALPSTLSALGWTTDRLGLRIAQGLGGFAFISLGMMLAYVLAGATPQEMLESALAFTPMQRGMFVIIGLLAAFVEETIFRGHLQPLASERLGPVWGPLLVALLFDIYHLAFGPIALLMKMWIATTLWLMRARTGTLVAGAIAHALTWIVWGAL